MKCLSIAIAVWLGATPAGVAAERASKQKTPPVEPKLGKVALRVDTAAVLVVDGENRGPLVPDRVYSLVLEQGPRALRVVSAGGEVQWQETVEVTPDQIVRIVALRGDAAQIRQDYMKIPAGSFEMGCLEGDTACADDEKPRHPVTITHDFWMMRTEVTARAYQAFTRTTGRGMPEAPEYNADWRADLYPVVNVAWDDAVAYCEWVGGRLPAEAEWERAGRGGEPGRLYAWGNDTAPLIGVWQQGNVCDDRAMFECEEGPRFTKYDDGYSYPSAAYQYLPMTGFRGLFETAGNALEWCADWHGPYRPGPARDPRGPETGVARVLRGGSYLHGVAGMRISNRFLLPPGERREHVGFRCVRDVLVPGGGE